MKTIKSKLLVILSIVCMLSFAGIAHAKSVSVYAPKKTVTKQNYIINGEKNNVTTTKTYNWKVKKGMQLTGTEKNVASNVDHVFTADLVNTYNKNGQLINEKYTRDSYVTVTEFKNGRRISRKQTSNGKVVYTQKDTYKDTYNKSKILIKYTHNYNTHIYNVENSYWKEEVTCYTSGKAKGLMKTSKYYLKEKGKWVLNETSNKTYSFDKNNNIIKEVLTGKKVDGSASYTITNTYSYKKYTLK